MQTREMTGYEERLLKTTQEFLVEGGSREAAALIVEADLFIGSDRWGGADGIILDVPLSSCRLIQSHEQISDSILSAVRSVARGRLNDQNGNAITDFEISFRVKLSDIEDGWRNVIKELIANSKCPNQGSVTELMRSREGKLPLMYNEMKFASQTEIRIAMEFERRKVLFFPLPLAVCRETGENYKDHREPDFLVCLGGIWGILEVSHHEHRYEKDSEKSAWFKNPAFCALNIAPPTPVGTRLPK